MLKNNGRQERRIIGRFGEIAFSRTVLIPADAESAKKLYSIGGRKAIYPLDHELKLDPLPFKVTHDMMCRKPEKQSALDPSRKHATRLKKSITFG